MVKNTIVYECGHVAPEVPTLLKKLKRSLSIKRALSKKALEPKEIFVEGICEECQRAPIEEFLNKGPDGKQVPSRATKRAEVDPLFVAKKEARDQQEQWEKEAELRESRLAQDRKKKEADRVRQSEEWVDQVATVQQLEEAMWKERIEQLVEEAKEESEASKRNDNR